jgi:CRP/FNR family transcriptional regulator, cyclic AMP receptor protein
VRRWCVIDLNGIASGRRAREPQAAIMLGMKAEETADLLGRVPLFAGLSQEEREQLAAVAVPRRYEPGQIIFREGDTGDTSYVIRDGGVRVMRNHSDGRTITLAELRSGHIFGELAMLDSETRSATVQAIERTSAIAILAGDLRRLLSKHPEIALKMLAGFAARLRAANERISSQSFQTVPSRVASVLLRQVETLQAEGAGERDVLVRATRADLAQLAGTSRESASRFLASLERSGVVTAGRGKVTVHDPAALRNYIY